MKKTVFLIVVLFITVIITGCSRQSGSVEAKKERLAIFTENEKLRNQIKQCNREIQQQQKQINEQQKQIGEQKKQIGESSQQIENLQKQLNGELEKSMAEISQGALDENAMLRKKIEQLEAQLKQCKE